jgi:hypothetical protein
MARRALVKKILARKKNQKSNRFGHSYNNPRANVTNEVILEFWGCFRAGNRLRGPAF